MTTQPARVAVKEGLFAGPLDDLESLHLCGSRCEACAEYSLGSQAACPNCGSGSMVNVAFSDEGTLYTYTIVRHRPPGHYRGPDDFRPFGVGLVELDGVIRVMAPLSLDIEDLRIGMTMRFRPHVLRTTEDGEEVVAFTYAAAGERM